MIDAQKKPTVLVVEDLPENIAVLPSGAYRVKVATNGEQALKATRAVEELLSGTMTGPEWFEAVMDEIEDCEFDVVLKYLSDMPPDLTEAEKLLVNQTEIHQVNVADLKRFLTL